MRRSYRRVAHLALFSALSLLLIFLASTAPTLRLSFCAAAGVPAAAAVLLYGVGGGFLTYAVAGLLSLFLLPGFMTPFLFLLFFGCYPVLKSLIERLGKLPLEWLLKLLFLNAVLTFGFLFFREFFTELSGVSEMALPLYALGNIAFVVYDIGLTGLLFALLRVLKKLKRPD